MAIDIQNLQMYYQEDRVLISDHAAMRCKQRGIKIKDKWSDDLKKRKGQWIMKCLSCKMEVMEEDTNSYFVKLSNCYVIIENVPCYKCSQCGEVFYKASVLEKIDDILEKLEHIASKIFILDYNQAA